MRDRAAAPISTRRGIPASRRWSPNSAAPMNTPYISRTTWAPAAESDCRRDRCDPGGVRSTTSGGEEMVRALVGTLGCRGSALGRATTALAQGYPNKPVTLYVTQAAGTSLDFGARVMAEAASKTLGQRIIIENRPAGGG